MIQPKNIQFTELIKAGGRLREFNFRQSQGLNAPLFTIDVASETGGREYVVYKKKENGWELENKHFSSWIEEVLPSIERIIEAYK